MLLYYHYHTPMLGATTVDCSFSLGISAPQQPELTG